MADHLARAFVDTPDRSLMLRRLASAAITERPPTGFLRNFVLHSGGERKGVLDIKRRGLLPVEALARWSGLRAGVSAASTRARLKASLEAGALSPDDARNLRVAFELFSALRMEHQVGQLREGVDPDDLIQPGRLAPLARTSLRGVPRGRAGPAGCGQRVRLPAPLTRARTASWREARFLAIDVETTGLDPRRDEVISFAGIPLQSARIIVSESVHGLVRPRAPSTSASIQIHRLREEDLVGAPRAPEALAPLAARIRGRIPVVHASWVERTFLRKAGCPLPRPIVDTAVLWRLLSIERGARDPGICSLSTIAGAHGLPAHRPHDAEGDALTAAQVFLAMATHLEARGHGTVHALTRARWSLRAWQLWHGPGGLRSG